LAHTDGRQVGLTADVEWRINYFNIVLILNKEVGNNVTCCAFMKTDDREKKF